LAHLSRVGLIKGRQESRFIFYAADYGAMDELLAFLTNNCCQGQACLPKTSATESMVKRRNLTPKTNLPLPKGETMSERVFNVLFLCTGNSARSILAESILNHVGKGRFRAFSAGSHPSGQINPFVLDLLRQQNMSVTELRSKHWDEFSPPDAPQLDFVFTVCDNAAGEVCPVWPGQPMTAHWGVEDPAAVEGDDETKRRAVSIALRQLNRRISLFISLPIAKLDAMALKNELDGIGKLREKGE